MPSLDLRQLELADQGFLGGLGVLGLADEPDHEVELIDGLAQPFEDVRLLLGPREVVLGPAGDHLAPEADELGEHLLQRHHLGPSSHQRQHDDAEGGLHLSVLIKLIDDDIRHLPASELQHDPDALATRLVAPLRDTLDPLVADQLADLLHQRRLVDLVRQLRDDDRLAAAAKALFVNLRP